LIISTAPNSLYFFVIAYIALQTWLFPVTYQIDLYSLFFGIMITATLLFSFINMQKVKYNPGVYKYLMSGFFFLFVAMLTDTLDEIFIQPWLLGALLEDTGQLIGYILVTYGLSKWIAQNNANSSKLKKLSEIDDLTQLYTRRYFNYQLTNLLVSPRIETFSILLINIDNFKFTNERYSQAAGDIVLKRLANKLIDCVRKTDTVARWGGEEFIILLNNSNDDIAKQVAETIRTNAELLCVEFDQDIINITVSIGAVTYKDELKSSELINSAEQCLSKAKQQGKNQVHVRVDAAIV